MRNFPIAFQSNIIDFTIMEILQKEKITLRLFTYLLIVLGWQFLCYSTPNNLLFASPGEDPYSDEWKLIRYTAEAGLPSNNIHALIQTTSGILWVQSSAGIAWFDGYEWINVDPSDGVLKGVPKIYSDLNSGIYALIDGQVYQGNQNGFRLLPFKKVFAITPYGKDTVLVFSQNTMSMYNLQSGQFSPPPPIMSKDRSTFGFRINSLGRKFIHSGRWLCAIEADTLRKIIPANSNHALDVNNKGNGIVSVDVPNENMGLWKWNNALIAEQIMVPGNLHIKRVAISNNDEIIVYSLAGNFYLRRDNEWIPLQFLSSKIKNVESLEYWGNNDIWINSGDGISLYRQSNMSWSNNLDKNEPYDIILEILSTRKGELWLGTYGGIKIIKSKGQKKYIRKIDNKLPFRTITGLAEDTKGDIWISSGEAFPGVYCWNGSSWKYFPIDNKSNTRIHKIMKDRSGALWFLGISSKYLENEPGAFRYSNGKFTHWGTKEGLVHDRVYSFVEGLDSSYWFATYGGISRWKNGVWKHWTTKNGLINNNIFTISVDKENTIWFGDRGTGLGHIDKDGKVSYLTLDNGLLSNAVIDLKYDSVGRLWISTKKGLNCYYNGILLQFGTKMGLSQQSIWPILPTKDKVYIGTEGRGLAILNLSKEKIYPPRIVIDKPIIENSSARLIWETFSFLGQQPNDDVQVRYRIVGGVWSKWSTKREFILNNLTSGSYTFEVQASDLFGNIGESTVRTSFIVPYHFTQRPEFIVPILSLSIIIIFLFINQILHSRQHSKSIQQSEIKFRRLTQATFEGIILFHEGIIIDVNPNIQNLLGYEPDELIGHPVASFLPEETFNKILSFEKQYREELIESMLFKKDKTKILTEILIKTLSTDRGHLEALTIRDITIRKEIERQLLSYQEQLRSLASQLVKTEEKDRRRIAAYLHDEISQSLALCKIKLGEIQKNKYIADIEEVRKMIEETLSRTQSLTFELSPPILYELGLLDAVEWLIEEMQKRYKITFHLEDDGIETRLSDDINVVLFQGIRELLINVVKHAKAKNVTVTIAQKENKIVIIVHDDGIAFDYPLTIRRNNKKSTFGLFNLRERLSQLGGNMQIESKHGEGTAVTLTAPINSQNDKLNGSIL